MPNLNDKDLEPVSFRKGGFTHGGQVHIEGTFAYLPKDLARWSEDKQVEELGDIYWSKGIRRGFTPASESYLAGEYQRRIAGDMEKSDRARASQAEIDGVPVVQPGATAGGALIPPSEEGGAPRVVTGGPTGEIRELSEDEQITLNSPGIKPGGVDPHTGEIPSGYTLQNPVTVEQIAEGGTEVDTGFTAVGSKPTQISDSATGDAAALPRNAEGEVPVHTELSTATTDESLTPGEKEQADAAREAIVSEPFEGARTANIEQTRAALADASDEDVAKFVEWEKARTDRAPRTTLLQELED